MPRDDATPATETPPCDARVAARIADAFRPAHPLGNRWDYHYVRSKLVRDPLYPGIVEALRDTVAPVFDFGCGLGLLAHVLRMDGLAMPYRGVDIDVAKIERARRAAERAELTDVAFAALDLAAGLAAGLPAHHGSVTLLDVLQFIPPQAHAGILDAAIAMLAPGAKLVIRTGLDDGSARARTTRRVDVLSRLVGWMNTTPKHYPEADALRARLEGAGLSVTFTPLYGDTPFNNWRVVATR